MAMMEALKSTNIGIKTKQRKGQNNNIKYTWSLNAIQAKKRETSIIFPIFKTILRASVYIEA